MIEDIFLAYANNSLKNNPQNFHSIFEEIDKNENFLLIEKSEFDPIIEYIIELSEFADSHEFLFNVKKHGSTNHYDDRFDNNLYHAVTAIAGERERFYTIQEIWQKRKFSKKEKKELLKELTKHHFNCDLGGVIKAYTGTDSCDNQFSQKCYECYQLKFRHYLLQIVNGKEYSEIDNFEEDILLWSEEISQSITWLFIDKKEGKPFYEQLASMKKISLSVNEFANSCGRNSNTVLNDFLFAVASYSLTEFLIANDRRKLKFCPYCENFFIAKDIKRKRCYSEHCKREYEKQKKQKQRYDDPVKYI